VESLAERADHRAEADSNPDRKQRPRWWRAARLPWGRQDGIRRLTGLTNLGNTCSVAAVFQAFAHAGVRPHGARVYEVVAVAYVRTLDDVVARGPLLAERTPVALIRAVYRAANLAVGAQHDATEVAGVLAHACSVREPWVLPPDDVVVDRGVVHLPSTAGSVDACFRGRGTYDPENLPAHVIVKLATVDEGGNYTATPVFSEPAQQSPSLRRAYAPRCEKAEKIEDEPPLRRVK